MQAWALMVSGYGLRPFPETSIRSAPDGEPDGANPLQQLDELQPAYAGDATSVDAAPAQIAQTSARDRNSFFIATSFKRNGAMRIGLAHSLNIPHMGYAYSC